MTTHQTLVVGRSLPCIQAIQQRLAPLTKVISVSRLTDLEESDLKSIPLIVLLHAPPEENGIARLKKLQAIFPKSFALLVGIQISLEDTLLAFRLGAKDVCTLENKMDFLDRLELLIQKTATNFKQNRLQSWLSSVFIPKDFLGIVANTNIFSSQPFEYFSSADLSVQFLGSFKIFMQGKPIEKPLPNKAKALLVYLLMRRRVTRTRLTQLFWRGQLEDSARNSLNVTLYTIRKWFESFDQETDYIICKKDYCEINESLQIETDYQRFSTAYQEARLAEQQQDKVAALNAYFKAYANYRGDFVENVSKEDWIESERDSLRENFLQILSKCCQLFKEEGRFSIVLNIANKMLQIDDCLENAHRSIMFAHWKMGNRRHAIRQFHACKKILKEELSINPSRKTLTLFEEIID